MPAQAFAVAELQNHRALLTDQILSAERHLNALRAGLAHLDTTLITLIGGPPPYDDGSATEHGTASSAGNENGAAAAPAAITATMSLHDALYHYERRVTPFKKGAAQEKFRIGLWQKSPIAEMPLNALRGAHIAEWRDQRLATKKSPTTVRTDLALISHLFTVASKEWGLEALVNPVQKIRMPRPARGRDRRLNPKRDRRGRTEEVRLMQSCEARTASWLAPMVRLAIETGMRQGELIALQWRYIDRRRRVARLPHTKNGEPRDVPLSKAAMAALNALLPRNAEGVTRFPRGRVFPEAAHTQKVIYEFRMACKAEGVKNLRFHDLRHEATSRFFERGLSLMEVASITGHKTLQMLQRYTHLKAEKLVRKLG